MLEKYVKIVVSNGHTVNKGGGLEGGVHHNPTVYR